MIRSLIFYIVDNVFIISFRTRLLVSLNPYGTLLAMG